MVAKSTDPQEVDGLIRRAKAIARRYYALTGRPLGVTGEVGEYEACRLLRLKMADVREKGYDASRGLGTTQTRFQVKTRCLGPDAKPGQKLGAIQPAKPWDVVLLVLLDLRFEPVAIYEANRAAIEKALRAPGPTGRPSKARERGQLTVSKFKSIGRLTWSRE